MCWHWVVSEAKGRADPNQEAEQTSAPSSSHLRQLDLASMHQPAASSQAMSALETLRAWHRRLVGRR